MNNHRTLGYVGRSWIPLSFLDEDIEYSGQEESCCRVFLLQKENELGIPNFAEFRSFQAFYEVGDIYQDQNYDCMYPMGLTLVPGLDHQQASSTLGGTSTNSEDFMSLHQQTNSQELSASQPKISEYLEEKQVIQTEPVKKRQKNQYDKNIAGNICSTVIKKMVSSAHMKEIRFYCRKLEVSYREYTEHFRNLLRKEKRFGTSQLYNFFSRSEDDGFQKVFGLFLTRYLSEEYLAYILSIGKMSNQRKYMECAINLMYIPKLNIQQTDLISQYHKLV